MTNNYNQFSSSTIYSIAEGWVSNNNTDAIVDFLKEDIIKEHKKTVMSAVADNHFPINTPLYNILLQLKTDSDYSFVIEQIFLKCKLCNR